MASFFIKIYTFFKNHKIAFWVLLPLLMLALAWIASGIKLVEDISQVLPQDKKIEHLQQFLQRSEFADKLVVILSHKTNTEDPDELFQIAESLTSSLDGSPFIKSIQAQVEEGLVFDHIETIKEQVPIYLEEKDYAAIDSLLLPENIQSKLASNYNLLVSPAATVMKGLLMEDPLGISMMGVKRLQNLQIDDQFELQDGYVMTKDLQNLLIFINPTFSSSETGQNLEMLQVLDETLDSLKVEFQEQDITYFGSAAVAAGNAKQLRQDMLVTQGSTVIILIVLIFLFFRKKRAPFLVLLPVVFGALFSLAIINLIKGEISVIALAAGSVVLGIAVNYSLHVYNHYRHSKGIIQVLEDLSIPMTIGSFSTIGGFVCLQFVKSPMLQDIGLVATFSLTGAVLFSLIFLPHLITMGRQNHTPVKENMMDFISLVKFENNKILVAAIAVLTIIFFFTSGNVRFESDMMKLNFMTPELRQAEDKLNSLYDFQAQTMYLVSEGRTLDEALQNRDALNSRIATLLDSQAIIQVSGTSGLLMSSAEQERRIERWEDFWNPDKIKTTLDLIQEYGKPFGFKSNAFDGFARMLNKEYSVISPQQNALLQNELLGKFVSQGEGRTSVTTFLKVDPVQRTQVYAALEGQPNNVVFDKQYTVNRLGEILREEFNSLAWMTGSLVFIVLLIAYGRIELALITFIPMLLSWIWILGIMGLFGISFNLVNIILSTFIFGLGDDYSIFTLDGLKQEYKSGSKFLPSFKSSIFFSAITTMLGLGVLIFAQHPSLRSIALISIIGILSVVITSQVIIPLLFKWLITSRTSKGKNPKTLFGILVTILTFSYFTLGSFLLSIISFLLLTVNPFFKKKSKALYHWIVCQFTRTIWALAITIKRKEINTTGETFKKPAIIIANHQSFLDILYFIALHPKVILMTNEWVYNSPIFGYVVRSADYYPAMKGVEGGLGRIKAKVDDGYSVVIFPEGTRSADFSIKRFHKGAFYLAEQLNLDILPILLHGMGHTLTKGEFYVKHGKVTSKILPRIKPGDMEWGQNYSERCKSISRYFKQEYEILRTELETPAYFKTKLLSNYVYKSPILEWYLKVKIKMENNYQLIHELLPLKGKIMDIGCGNGFLCYMLSFLSPEREILGLDYDEEKVATAQHAYSKTDKINFLAANIMDVKLVNQDAFVLMDVLHYLEPEDQQKLLVDCIHHLNPGGVIVLRDGVTDIGTHHKQTELSELFSTKLLGFNKKGALPLSFTSYSILKSIVENSGAEIEIKSESQTTSNVVFVIKLINHGSTVNV